MTACSFWTDGQHMFAERKIAITDGKAVATHPAKRCDCGLEIHSVAMATALAAGWTIDEAHTLMAGMLAAFG